MVRIRTKLKKRLQNRLRAAELAGKVRLQREYLRYSKLLNAVRKRVFDYEDMGKAAKHQRAQDRVQSVVKTYAAVLGGK